MMMSSSWMWRWAACGASPGASVVCVGEAVEEAKLAEPLSFAAGAADERAMFNKIQRTLVVAAAALGFLLPAGAGRASEPPPLMLKAPAHAYASDGLPTFALVNSSESVIHNLEAACVMESVQLGTLTMRNNRVVGYRSEAVQPGESVAVSCQPPILTDAAEISGTVRVEAQYVFQGKLFRNSTRIAIETREDGRMVLR